jgi:hypothetical protein
VTVGDVRSESPYLNDQNGHLFFGSGAFRQLSIGKGPPPVTAIASAPPLANPSESNFNTTTEVPQGSILDLKFNPQNVDSTDATMVHDLSAVHHAAMLQNVPIVKNLETGWAAEFNGKDSSVSLGNDPVFQMSGGITVAARIRPTGAKKDAEHIVAKEDWENRTTNGYVLRLLDGKPEFTIGMNGWQGIESGNDLDRNKWHTIAGSFDGNTMKLYVDGEMVASRAVHGLISPSKYPLVIGNSPFDDKRRFEGEISEVWLANQAWPSEIISQLANRQIVSASGRTTDLLKMIDLSRDVVSGSWQLQNGVLISDKSDPAKLQLPYHPPEEYDFKIVFTPISGEEKVIQICQAGGHQFLLQIGSTHNSVYGFDGINGTGENPTVRRTDNWIKNGQEYTSIIKVRKTGVQSFLDGKLISEWATDYHDMSLYEGWKLKTYNSIGIGSALRPTKFEAIEVTEISGS